MVKNGRKLLELNTGASGYISHFTNPNLAARLMTMGVLPNSEVTIIRKTFLGGSLYIKTDKHSIALRKQEAACIILK